MKMKPGFMLFFLVCIFSAFPVQAAPITVSYSFEAGGFGASAPQAFISGFFTATFIPLETGNGINQASLDAVDLTINGHHYNLSNTGVFVQNGRYHPMLGHTGKFFLGGLANGGVLLGATYANDFRMSFLDSGTDDYAPLDFKYWLSGAPSVFHAETVKIKRLESVPLPGAGWLFLSGCLFLGGVKRQSRKGY